MKGCIELYLNGLLLTLSYFTLGSYILSDTEFAWRHLLNLKAMLLKVNLKTTQDDKCIIDEKLYLKYILGTLTSNSGKTGL